MSGRPSEAPEWDAFIAHAGTDTARAVEFVDHLRTGARVFVDTEYLAPGDRWGLTLAQAQARSRVTVAVLGTELEGAYYLSEEIGRAIDLERRFPGAHALIPVYLDGLPASSLDVPYGLFCRQSIGVIESGGLAEAARQVLEALPCAAALDLEQVQASTTRDPLSDYPRGPMVESHLIPPSLPQAYARLVKPTEAKLVLAEAEAFRRLGTDRDSATTLRLEDLPPPGSVSPREFWLDAFFEAGRHGPRMLAALVLVVPDNLFPEQARRDRAGLLASLRES